MPDIATRATTATSLARALLETSHLPLVLFDSDLRVVSATRSFFTVFDLDPDAVQGRLLSQIGDGEWDIPQVRLLLENAVLGGEPLGDYETELSRKDKDARQLVVNVQNIVYDDKINARVLLTLNDVTDVRRIEQLNVTLLLEKDALLHEREILLQEMQHRVANSLQIIASVLLLKARTVKSEETRLHLRDAHDRVMSVAAVQQLLQATLGDVEVGPYLTKLCDSLAASMIRDSRPLTIAVEAELATVTSHEAVSLGLIVTELVINALKHAFPGDRGGTVRVSYTVGSPGWTLSVTDNGVGRPPASLKRKNGLGTVIVESLAKQLDARVVLEDAHPGARISLMSISAHTG
ncbi:MAG: histidine kinase dimerization/phosphoacceptor domain -containing protein [Caulobacter sp.]|nr:histidine kinase dimerization/phosphoacceptor domain -containing protein [Caulobacter sp.]